MTAALLNRFIGTKDRSITLIESAEIGTIGVGEATVPPLVGYLKDIGVPEHEFMRRCHATYKLGIQFTNWCGGQESFWHPFGVVGGFIDKLPAFHFWTKYKRVKDSALPYQALAPNATAGDLGKAPHSDQPSSNIGDRGSYAYHLDASAFAEMLRDVAVRRGVTHLIDEVREVVLDDRGYIKHIETAGENKLEADFYIDCSGFRSLLIGQAMGDPYIDWGQWLLCDRAVAMPLAQTGEFPPFTRATALDAGWVWRIPLSNRVGCGYVFSSSHRSDEQALRELRKYTGQAQSVSDPFFLNMRVGRRKNFWAKNCLAIGLSSGFLEPLESTGIYLIQAALQLFTYYFPDRDFNPLLVKRFNHRMGEMFEEVRDFIILHYLLSGRDDTDFWTDCREIAIPDSLGEFLEIYDDTGIVETSVSALFPDTSYYSIFAGLGRLPRNILPRANLSDFDKVELIIAKILKMNKDIAHSLPSHEEALNRLHQTPPRS